MYPPRSEKNKKKQQEKRRRQNRMWLLLNMTLITLIFVLGAYFYMDERTGQAGSEVGTEQLPGVSGETVPDEGDSTAGDTPITQPEGNDAAPSGTEKGNGPDETAAGDNSPGEGDAADGGEVGLADPSSGTGSGKRDGGDAEQLLIHFAGDTIFSGKVEERLKKMGYEFPYQYVRGLFQNDDLSVLNLETPVTTGGDPAEGKTFVFKSPPKAIGPMAQAGVDAVNLANNHVLD
ncbi:MAG: CapA family protein, partial [Paenibacillaceae bacterium]|nr:CapA family protein [Paenibacillaceae bacterium]